MNQRAMMKKETKERISRFQQVLGQHGVDGALIVQRTDLYYLSGTDQDAHLWVPASGRPLLMVRKSFERAKQDAVIDRIVPFTSLSQLPTYMKEHSGGLPGRMGLEMDVLPVKFYLAYQRQFPETEMTDISEMIRQVRMVKSPYEVERVVRAARMADRMLGKIPEFLSKAKRDIDLTLMVEAFYRSQGHPGIIPSRGFNRDPSYGQIMSGRRAAIPSNSAGPHGGEGLGPFFSRGGSLGRISKRSPILVDYAANVEGYIADQTRIFSIGPLKRRLRQAHDVTLKVQEAIVQEAKPGVRAGDLYDLAIRIAKTSGGGEGFMGHPDPVPFVGHGVGLELNELPLIGRGADTVLAPGMTFTLEPKFIIPGEGIVGIENTFVVTEKGLKRLNRFPDGIAIC
jgi:Xaa-Pro dipeptidase